MVPALLVSRRFRHRRPPPPLTTTSHWLGIFVVVVGSCSKCVVVLWQPSTRSINEVRHKLPWHEHFYKKRYQVPSVVVKKRNVGASTRKYGNCRICRRMISNASTILVVIIGFLFSSRKTGREICQWPFSIEIIERQRMYSER